VTGACDRCRPPVDLPGTPAPYGHGPHMAPKLLGR
jgi:hypothetical protein